ncbi:MAG: aminotransferase class V-fold PLP-dependent enzyme [Candidatus Omnitrophota bacterium]
MAFFKKIPIVATDFSWHDILSMLRPKYARQRLTGELSQHLNSKYIFSLNSGTSAFYLILKVLSYVEPDRKEVILPAYTAASLILPIKKLGLKAVLCDISLETFDLDITKLSNLLCDKTLCVLAIHTFGLVSNVEEIKNVVKGRREGIFVIEDCAQAFGTVINNKLVGCQGDISLYSFNRGKNISTAGGGIISTNSEILANILKEEVNSLNEPSLFKKINIILELIVLSFVVRPSIYNCLYPLLKAFRSARPPIDFSVFGYTDFQAAIFLSLLKKLECFNYKRYVNGSFFYGFLKKREEIVLPKIFNSSKPAYNRFPILFKDNKLKERIKKELLKQGIDSSEMYERPLHLIFDLGYEEGDFPNAEYFASHLLTLPTHPLVDEYTLNTFKKIFERVLMQ